MNRTTALRVVVTGGAGFVGSHLCERLLRQGHSVLCVDNFQTGSERNIAHLRGHPGFTLRRHDVTRPLLAEADQIYNLACPASPQQYQRDPVRTIKTCVTGANNMLELARRLRVPILQASTSEVYGDPAVHPQPERYCGNVNPVGLRACYDEGKRCAEALFMAYRRQYGVRIKIARIFNTYGPRMGPEDGRVVPNFILQALAQLPLTVHGDGLQTRSFCYVDDLVDGLQYLMGSPDQFCTPVNLGNPVESTMLELAAAVVALCGSRSALQFLPRPGDDPARRRPDIRLALHTLGWTPRVDLQEGLRRTIAYFRQLAPAPPYNAPVAQVGPC